ncbi:hypothetical protein PMAYCL1PPCAC_04850, partial [Pristionchus mayeri]
FDLLEQHMRSVHESAVDIARSHGHSLHAHCYFATCWSRIICFGCQRADCNCCLEQMDARIWFCVNIPMHWRPPFPGFWDNRRTVVVA